MDLKKLKIVGIIIVAISLIFSCILSFQKNKKSLNLVINSICADDGTIYLIDENNEYCNIYHIDQNGKYINSISQKKVTKKYYYTWNNLFLYNDNVYFVSYKNYTASNEVGQRTLLKCNFDNNSVEEVSSLDNSSIYSYYIKDNVLNIATTYFDDEYTPCMDIYSSNIEFNDLKNEKVHNITEYGMDYYQIILDKYNNKFFVTIDNELYKVLGKNKEEKIYPNTKNKSTTDFGGVIETSYDNNDKIYFIDFHKEKLMYYDISNEVYKEIDNKFYSELNKYNQNNGTSYKLSDFKNFKFNSKGYFTSSINNFENNYVLITFNQDGIKIIDTIKNCLGTPKLILITIGYFLLSSLVLTLIILLIYTLKKSYIYLIIRMLIIFLCLYSVIVVSLFCIVKPYLNQTFENLTYDNALYICQNKLNLISTVSNEDVEKILNTRYNGYLDGSTLSEDQKIVYSIINAQYGFSMDGREYNSTDNSTITSEISSTTQCEFAIYFLNSNNETIMAYNSSYNTNVPIDYKKTRYVCDVAKKVILTGEKQFTSDLYLMQYVNTLYAPIFNEENQVVGLFEVNLINNLEKFFKVNEMINTLLLEVTIIILILIVIVSIMLFIFLKPLKDLKNKALDLTSGNIGIKVQPKGNNEITLLAIQFNKISKELERKISSMNDLKNTYKNYIPNDICNLLKKLNISKVSIGDTNNLSLAVMYINLSMDNVDVENRTFVTILNKFLDKIGNIINNNHGFIEHYDRHIIKVLYNEKYNNAIRTAVSINELINELTTSNNNFNISVTTFINFENTNLTIIGDLERMNFVTSSKNTLDFNSLQKTYGSCNVIVTHNIIEMVDDFFETFDSRFIGISYINGQPIKLFEVFNGNDLYNKNMKRIYKDNFETAVELYLTKDFRTARNMFVEIFENYPKDILSKNYIYLCDDFLNGGDTT